MRQLYLNKQEDRLVFLGELQKTTGSKRSTMTATTFDLSSVPLTAKLPSEDACVRNSSQTVQQEA